MKVDFLHALVLYQQQQQKVVEMHLKQILMMLDIMEQKVVVEIQQVGVGKQVTPRQRYVIIQQILSVQHCKHGDIKQVRVVFHLHHVMIVMEMKHQVAQ